MQWTRRDAKQNISNIANTSCSNALMHVARRMCCTAQHDQLVSPTLKSNLMPLNQQRNKITEGTNLLSLANGEAVAQCILVMQVAQQLAVHTVLNSVHHLGLCNLNQRLHHLQPMSWLSQVRWFTQT